MKNLRRNVASTKLRDLSFRPGFSPVTPARRISEPFLTVSSDPNEGIDELSSLP
jgi:hypothetical protein